jgi:hypothetical protein
MADVIAAAEKLARDHAEFRRIEAELVAKYAPTLTPGLVRKLERKLERGENLSDDEVNQWFAAVKLSEPSEPPEHVIIDEGDEWPPDPPSHAAWDRWYETPISKMLVATSRPTSSRAPGRTRLGNPRPRGRRRRRARSPAQRTSAGDGDPLPLADPPSRVLYAHSARVADRRVAAWLESWGDEALEDMA